MNKHVLYNNTCKTNMKFIILACLFVLVLIDYGITNTASVSASENVAVKKTSNLYIDQFNRLRKLSESDLKIVKFFVKIRNNWKTTTSDDTDQIARLIDEYINDFERGSGPISKIRWTKQTAEEIAKNPIASYRLLRRYSIDLPKILNTDQPILEKMETLIVTDKVKWPDSEDLKYAAKAILNIQNIYNISAEQFSRGSLPGIELVGKFDLVHIHEIADTALSSDNYVLAIEWWEFGLWKIQAENIKGRDRKKFTKFLQLAKELLDEEYKKLTDQHKDKRRLHQSVSHEESVNETSIVKRVNRRDGLFRKFRGDRKLGHEDINMWGLCTGENYQTEDEKRHLFCWYEFTVHPRYRIAPLKMEFHFRQPDIYTVHNFVSDSLIQKVRRSSRQEDRLKFFKPNRKAYMYVDEEGRGATSIIWDGLGNTLGLLPFAQNVMDAFRMKAPTNYESDNAFLKSSTWATHAPLHTDSPWIATAMHYLNTVDFGGLTAFPRLGFAVKPVKGSLLFWMNQYRDQNDDQLTQHCGCPVLFGRKQVALKLFYSEAQFHEFPCDVKPGQRFKTKVNGRLDY